MYGDVEDEDARYARCDKLLTVVRALWRGETVDIHGDGLATPTSLPCDPRRVGTHGPGG